MRWPGGWRRDPGVSEVHVAPGNAGMADVATVHPGVAIGDLDGLERVVDVIAPDLIVIGPEAPLAAGVVDRLSAAGALVFGPAQSAAAIGNQQGVLPATGRVRRYADGRRR